MIKSNSFPTYVSNTQIYKNVINDILTILEEEHIICTDNDIGDQNEDIFDMIINVAIKMKYNPVVNEKVTKILQTYSICD